MIESSLLVHQAIVNEREYSVTCVNCDVKYFNKHNIIFKQLSEYLKDHTATIIHRFIERAKKKVHLEQSGHSLVPPFMKTLEATTTGCLVSNLRGNGKWETNVIGVVDDKRIFINMVSTEIQDTNIAMK